MQTAAVPDLSLWTVLVEHIQLLDLVLPGFPDFDGCGIVNDPALAISEIYSVEYDREGNNRIVMGWLAKVPAIIDRPVYP